MVPYNHSIHEIFQAAEMMGVFDTGDFKYSIDDTDLDNLNRLLAEMGMDTIVPAWGSHTMPSLNPTRRENSVYIGGVKRRKTNKRKTNRRKMTRRKMTRRKTKDH